jgi:hypothetical protein
MTQCVVDVVGSHFSASERKNKNDEQVEHGENHRSLDEISHLDLDNRATAPTRVGNRRTVKTASRRVLRATT